jgi:hypothetical protein
MRGTTTVASSGYGFVVVPVSTRASVHHWCRAGKMHTRRLGVSFIPVGVPRRSRSRKT